MSRSPKYTPSYVTAARERELEERRRERERQRQEEAAAEHRRQVAAHRTALEGSRATTRQRATALQPGAAAAGLAPTQAGLVVAADGYAATISSAGEHELGRIDGELRGLNQQVDRLSLEVSEFLARRERQGALKATRATLDEEADRAHLDPAGYAEVDRLLGRAEQAVGDVTAFQAVHRELTAAIAAHLDRARARRLELAAMRRESQELTTVLGGLIAEADEVGAELVGLADCRALLSALAAEVAAEDTTAARRSAERGRALHQALVAAFDTWQDESDRTELIMDALANALPKVGLSIVPGSYRQLGSGSTLVAQQSDGSTVQIAVVPDEDGQSQIVYHASGRDFVLEQTADGEVARCDLTAEILEKLHDRLREDDVETGDLFWEGKPRPDQFKAKNIHTSTQQPRSAGGH